MNKEHNITEIPTPAKHLVLKDTKRSSPIDFVIDKIGKAASWLWLLTALVIICSVILRYIFESGLVMLEELSWYLYGICWLIGLSFAFIDDSHVRVGILYENFSNKKKLWLELIGSIILLLPFLSIVLLDSIPYFMDSYVSSERSVSPGGLPYRWIVKLFIPVSFFLLFVAALSRLYRCIYTLTEKTKESAHHGS